MSETATHRYFNREELAQFGFKSLGDNVFIDRNVIIIGASNISLGSNVRIDAHGLITAGEAEVLIGSHVHLAAGVYLFGGAGIEICDFVGLSGRVSVYSSSDDYTGEFLTGPTVPDKFRGVVSGKVIFKKHAIVGAGSVVLPNVTLGIGCAVGALTVVRRSVPPFSIVCGNPMEKIGERKSGILELERQLFSQQ